MSDDAAPSTAGFNIPIPVDTEMVIAAMRKAIKEVSSDLDKLRKKAEDQMKQGGVVDSALASEIGALGRARDTMKKSLSEKREELSARNEANAAEKARQEEEDHQNRRKYAQSRVLHAGMHKLGVNPGVMASAVSQLYSISFNMGTYGGYLRAMSGAKLAEDTATAAELNKMSIRQLIARTGKLSRAAGAEAAAQGGNALMATVGTALETAAPIAARIAGVAADVTPYMAPLMWGRNAYAGATAGVKTGGELAQERASAFFDQTRRDEALNTGGLGTAQRVFRNQQAAEAYGRESGVVGAFARVTDPFSDYSGQRGDQARQRMAHEKQKEAYRQRFGLNLDPDKAAINIANTNLSRDANIFRSFWTAAGLYTKYAYYNKMSGEGDKFLQQTWDDYVRQASDHKMNSDATAWEKYEERYAKGGEYAINRVLENEQRRWLRDVEVDRIARFNDWSML
jgi:hypothetical protein